MMDPIKKSQWCEALRSGDSRVVQFADAIMHGDDEHRDWLALAAMAFENSEPLPSVSGGKSWRCFCCDEVFTDEAKARLHFGDLTYIGIPISDPACGVSLERFREMEHQLQRYNMGDSDKDREIYAMQADHAAALRREEERGYARGLLDMTEQARREVSL